MPDRPDYLLIAPKPPDLKAQFPRPNGNAAPIQAPLANIDALFETVRQLKMAVDSLIGQTGPSTNRAVTFDDLVEIGLMTRQQVTSKVSAGSGGVAGGSNGGSGSDLSPGNPTAIAGDIMIPGVALTYMRSDGAPAIQLSGAATFGLVKPDNVTMSVTGGVMTSLVSGSGPAGPPGATGPTGPPRIATLADAPPATPAVGDEWYDSVGGQLYIWFNDGTSSQWVPTSNQPGPPGAVGAVGSVGPTGATGAASTVPGPPGATGPIGSIGPIGPTGATGATGASGTSGPWTVGAIPFANTTSSLGQDPTQLWWDDTNNRLGVGTAGPAAKFDIVATATTPLALHADNYYYAQLFSNQASSQVGYQITVKDAGGANIPSAYIFAIGGAAPYLGFVAPGTNNGDMFFGPNNGGGGLTTALTIKGATGFVGIGVSPSARLDVQAPADNTNVVLLRRSTGAISHYDFISGSGDGGSAIRNSAGTEMVFLHSNGSSYFMGGNVGIGTTSPGYKLQVRPAVDVNIITYQDVTTGGGAIGVLNDALTTWVPLNIQVAGNVYMCRAAGNVGIGMTNPGYKLDVTGAIHATLQGNLFGSAAGDFASPTPSNTNVLLYNNGTTNWSGIGSNGGGHMYFVTGTAAPATRMVIDIGGNVGIGTTSPLGRFHVAGPSANYTVYYTWDAANYRNSVTHSYSGGAAASCFMGFNICDGTSTGQVSALTIDGTGRAGVNRCLAIACSEVNYRLAIRSPGIATLDDYVALIVNNHNTAGDKAVLMGVGSNAADTTSRYFLFWDGGFNTVQGGINRNGSGAVAFTTTSDERLKDNIRPTQTGIEALMRIPVEDYRFKGDDRDQQGFRAQALHQVYPVAVMEGDDDTPWMVEYGRVTPLCVRGIQEQQDMIEMLTRRLAAVEARLGA